MSTARPSRRRFKPNDQPSTRARPGGITHGCLDHDGALDAYECVEMVSSKTVTHVHIARRA
jgi:hypothetical protein